MAVWGATISPLIDWLIVFQAKMSHIFCFKVLNCEDLLLFFVADSKWRFVRCLFNLLFIILIYLINNDDNLQLQLSCQSCNVSTWKCHALDPACIIFGCMKWSVLSIWVIYHCYKIHTSRHKQDKKPSAMDLIYCWMYLCVGLLLAVYVCLQCCCHLGRMTSFLPLYHLKTPEAMKCTVSVCVVSPLISFVCAEWFFLH